MTGAAVYEERLSSIWTELLFLALLALFAALSIWRVDARGPDVWAGVFIGLAALFLFYSLNYRTLTIRIDPDALTLAFGLFRGRVPLDNIADCRPDSVPLLMRYGGAGIHFMMTRKRYRASFNFLEYPRVVVALKRKVGPVQDISFSTRRPEEVVELIGGALT